MEHFSLCKNCRQRFRGGPKGLLLSSDGGCFICNNAMGAIGQMASSALQAAADAEWSTFSVSSRFPKQALVRDSQVASHFAPGAYIAIKNQANSDASRLLGAASGKGCSQRDADMNFTFDFPSLSASAEPSPIFVHGHYTKLSRKHCQSVWHCSKCGGRGCGKCEGSGHNYPSVEGELCNAICPAFSSKGCSLHASGREDVDVRALGSGRPFVLSVLLPKKRSADLSEIERRLSSNPSVRAHGLRLVRKGFIDAVCGSHFEKEYSALVSAGRKLTEKDARLAEALSGAAISQQTPKRVLSRRADIVRKRKIFSLKAAALQEGKLRLEILAEAGTYIKELISSDSGRTKPSISSLLGCDASCDELDVVWMRDFFLQTLPALSGQGRRNGK